MQSLEQLFAEFIPLCAVVAALEVIVDEDSTVLGFRSICGLAITLSALHAILHFIQ